MTDIDQAIFEQVINGSSEAVVIVRLDHTDWPIVLANAAFEEIGGEGAQSRPFAEVIETLVGRDLALEVSATFRSSQETSFPVEIGGNEYLLALKPLLAPSQEAATHYAVFWRGGGAAVAGGEAHQALLRAKRKIRDLTREDAVTGLLNERAFRDVLEHDWAVASREKSRLALVLFTVDDFDAYVDVFGRHASDSCLRRVGQAIRRCLRRASDVVANVGDARLIVLSHSSGESSVREFAEQISAAVRELGLHHPRSSHGRFVTVSHKVEAVTAGAGDDSAEGFLIRLMGESGRR